MTEQVSDAMIEAISKLVLETHEEAGMYAATIAGSGIDLAAQGDSREQALERLSMQAAAELVYSAHQARPVDEMIELLREVLTKANLCECGQSECLTKRIRESIEGRL